MTVAIVLLAVGLGTGCRPGTVRSAAELQEALRRGGGEVALPAGTITIDAPLEVPAGAKGLMVRGDEHGSTIALSAAFKGKAAIVVDDPTGLTLTDFRIEGNRETPQPTDVYLPPSNVTFADFYDGNGVVVRGGTGIAIERLEISRMTGFAVIVSAARDVGVESVTVRDSGSLNSIGRNNTSGGILIEEGTEHFTVRDCRLERVAGNAIWTHSNYGSARNADGTITGNSITEVARDAIQVGHATRVEVTGNEGSRIGFPLEYVDREGQGNPAALDSAGDVDASAYLDNHFRDVNGHCIDLDGFHGGRVTENSCLNLKPDADYPFSTFGVIFNNTNIDMTSSDVELTGNLIYGFAYGGVYAMGSDHTITGNYFLDVNRARCTGDPSRNRCQYAPEEPGALRTGIFLTRSGVRPIETRGNVIRDNVVVGFGMDRWCTGIGPGIKPGDNTFAGNVCRGEP